MVFCYFAGYTAAMLELQAIGSGKVHGVAYRTYVQDVATVVGLVGTVQNMSDGTVQVIAHGLQEDLKELVEHLYEGSLLAQVESVAVEWGNPQVTFTEFSVLH